MNLTILLLGLSNHGVPRPGLGAQPGSTGVPGAPAPTPSPTINILLSLLIWLPVVGALIAGLMPARNERDLGRIRTTAITFTISAFVVALWGYHNYLPGTPLHYEENLGFLSPIGSAYHLAMDGISAPLLVLNALVAMVAVLASWNLRLRVREYFVLLLLLDASVTGFFASRDMLLMLGFWLAGLVPMFLLLAIWGGARRMRAAWSFLVYSLVGSALLVTGVTVMYAKAGLGTFDIASLTGAKAHYPAGLQVALFTLMLLAFTLRLPVFPLHSWLPEAISEAPSAIGLYLVAVFAGMGGYGLIRFGFNAFPEGARRLLGLVVVMAVLSIFFGTLTALAQTDIRKVVGFLSVSTSGLVLLALTSFTQAGMVGGLLLLVTGLSALGALNLLLGMLQERLRSRSLFDMGGLASRLPGLTAMWILTSIAVIGLPGTGGFLGNVLTLMGTFVTHRKATLMAAVGLVLVAAVLLRVLEKGFFAPSAELEPRRLRDVTTLEIWSVALILAVVLWIGIFPSGPQVADSHVLEPGILNVMTDGLRPVADHYAPSARVR